MAPAQTKDVRTCHILWLSYALGYHDDLMYGAPIIAALARRFPRFRITVSENFPCDRYPGLPLWPVLHDKLRILPGAAYTRHKRRLMAMPPAMLRALWRDRPDVFIAVEFTPLAVSGLVLAKLLGRRSILLIENHPRYRNTHHKWPALLVKSLLARLADVIMTSNEQGHAFVTGALRIPAGRVLTAPYLTSDPLHPQGTAGEGTAPGIPATQGPAPARRPDCINILFLNSISERKGLAELVGAVALMPPAARDRLFFHVAGDGPAADRVRALVTDKGLDNSFRFYGPVPFRDTARFYRAADAYISPTLQDYRSLGGFEALNCGLPLLISVRDGACAEIVTPGVNGWTFDPLDRRETVACLVALAESADILPRYAQASRDLSARYKVERIADNFERAIERAMITGGKRRRT